MNAYNSMTLEEIAYEAMLARGFIPDFPTQVTQEVAAMQEPFKASSAKDKRDLLWVSIDNDESRDLDQLTFAEQLPSGKTRVYVAVADVDSLVKQGSATDQQAAYNTTSVYTPTKVFPMLPFRLSTDLTSLNEGEDRAAMVVEMDIALDGRYDLHEIYPARVRNHAKLTYKHVTAAILEQIPLSSHPDPLFLKQVQLQDEIATRIKEFRNRQGALTFASMQVQPLTNLGEPMRLEPYMHTRAHMLIENFMIAANVTVTRFLQSKNLPTLQRVLKAPKRWDRIVALAKDFQETLPDEPDIKALRDFLVKRHDASPSTFPDLSLAVIKLIGRGEYVVAFPGNPSPGHFDLALRDYAHTTAPNRRYPDLIMQRLLKSCFGTQVSYTPEELISMAKRCTEKEDDATKVERRVQKSAAAIVLSDQIGQKFEAIVTGASDKGTWVRLLHPPIEGRLYQGYQGVDVGNRITVQLIHVDIPNGYIDFSKA